MGNKNRGARAAHEPSNVKTPRTAQDFPGQKQPRLEAGNAPSDNELTPAWRFTSIRLVEPFGWHSISRDEMLEVIDRLKNLESMTWNDIVVTAKKQNHSCSVDELSKDAQKCLEQDWQGADEVISLRVTAKKRIWGIRDRGVLHLLWWDPEHEVYPSTYMDRNS